MHFDMAFKVRAVSWSRHRLWAPHRHDGTGQAIGTQLRAEQVTKELRERFVLTKPPRGASGGFLGPCTFALTARERENADVHSFLKSTTIASCWLRRATSAFGGKPDCSERVFSSLTLNRQFSQSP